MPPPAPSELLNKVLVNPEVNPLDPLSLDELGVRLSRCYWAVYNSHVRQSQEYYDGQN